MIVTFLYNGESIHSVTDCENLKDNLKTGEEIIVKGIEYKINKIDLSINGKISLKVFLIDK